MTGSKKTTILIYGIFATSLLISLLVLNRWVVTDLGLVSYGRVWQLYISYEDFGFVRRALAGTLFSVTGLNTVLANEYHFAFASHHVAIIALMATVLIAVQRQKINDIALVATVALSPALIIQSAYSTGSLDIFVLLLAAVNILYVRHHLVFSTIVVLGVFVHELFIFTVPAQIAAYCLAQRQRGEAVGLSGLSRAVLPCVAAVAVLSAFGTTDLAQPQVEEIMRAKLPNAADQHPLWSGYFEISKSASENSDGAVLALINNDRAAFRYLLVPMIYVILVGLRLLAFARSVAEGAALFLAANVPLLTSLVATDLYRWIGMSASLGLLLTLVVLREREDTHSLLTYALLPFSLLAPFGGPQINWPFPGHQFILQQFLF